MNYSSNEWTRKCLTQESDRLVFWSAEDDSGNQPITVGDGPIVPRWKVHPGGTTLKYFVDNGSFKAPHDRDAAFAAEALRQAAEEYNSLRFGVSFARASQRQDANFSLAYMVNTTDENTRALLAHAFFPHVRDPSPKLIVRDFALKPQYRASLKDIFCHELGHILGLRHEFATYYPEGQTNPAVVFNGRDPRSVMGYGITPPSMQDSDRQGVIAFYNWDKRYEITRGVGVVEFDPKMME